MELVLDTANVDAIKTYTQMLNIAGVTTNPKIIAQEGKDPKQAADDVLSVLSDEQKFFMQATATDVEGIVKDAEFVCRLRPKNNYIKIPCTPAGLEAMRRCKERGFGVLGTVVFTAEQGFLAALNGADYLAPYVNRISNQDADGVDIAIQLIDMLAINDMPAKVMGASFHNIAQVRKLIEAGIGAVTLPINVLEAIVHNPTTQATVDDFTKLWNETYHRTGILA